MMASTSTQQHQLKYDVFVSYRSRDIRSHGDTGKKFTDHLFEDFKEKGIRAVIEDKNSKEIRAITDDTDSNIKNKNKKKEKDPTTPLGKIISSDPNEVMQESAFLLVIFSKEFESSSWCVRELVKIFKWNSNRKQQLEVNILCYDVRPSELGKATRNHAKELKNLSPSTANNWKLALSNAKEFPSADRFNRDEYYRYIHCISEEILDALSRVPLHLGENLVGVDACVKEMNLSQFVESDKVKMFGIYGSKGTGKTTLAKAAYNEMSAKFDKCFFFEVVEKQQSPTQAQTQLIIYGKTMKTRVKEISNDTEGAIETKQEMPKKQILVVLENVDDRDQLQALVDLRHRFFGGSLMIFTSKDRELLRSRMDETYDIPVLPYYTASELVLKLGAKPKESSFMVANSSTSDLLPHGYETKFIASISEQVLKMCHDHVVNATNLLPQFRQLGDLKVPDNLIDETIVFEGTLDTRPVTVKRIAKAHVHVAVKEIKNLIDTDQHPNIVQYYGAKEDTKFVYMALERCACSLRELVLSHTDSTLKLKMQEKDISDFKLLNFVERPSLELLKVMRDTVNGLAHLHGLGFIHRDLNPENVLIFKDGKSVRAKLSGMSMSTSEHLRDDSHYLPTNATGSGSSGWQAPEQLRNEQITQAVDLFSFGCVLFFCITGGRHPFGDDIDIDERDRKIAADDKNLSLVDNIPEAFDLIFKLLNHKPQCRPEAAVVYNHPLFWDSDTRLSFLQDASDCVDFESKVTNSKIFEKVKNINIKFKDGIWNKHLDEDLVTHLEGYRQYEYHSICDLLRAIRNTRHHYRNLTNTLKEVVGPVPIGFEYYFSSQFPKHLMEVYKILQDHRAVKGDLLEKYYKQDNKNEQNPKEDAAEDQIEEPLPGNLIS